MKAILLKNKRRLRRLRSVRSRLRRATVLLRLSITRSVKHFSAQIIDDASGRTLAAATSTSKALGDQLTGKTKSERAKVVGGELARKAKEAGIEKVTFDRGHAKFHGRVKAFAEGAREGGLKF